MTSMRVRLAALVLVMTTLACALESPRVVTDNHPRMTEFFLRHNVDQEPARVDLPLEGGFRKPYEVEK